MMIDFDQCQDWFPAFDSAFGELTRDIDWKRHTGIEYTDDAYQILRDHVSESQVTEAFYRSFKSALVIAYHGTRLTDTEVQDVIEHGLKPLSVAERTDRYHEVFGSHPEWPMLSTRLEGVLHDLGPKASAGPREDGRVWCCYSRAGVLDCDFTVHGAEIDHHVARQLFGSERAHAYLRSYGLPRIVRFWCTLPEAEAATRLFYDKPHDELSSFAKTLIGHWAYSKIVPRHCCASERDATQMGCSFRVGANRIMDIETLAT